MDRRAILSFGSIPLGLADSFNPNANSTVFAIAVQPDGKVLAGGDFITLAPNGGAPVTRNRIARLETDGRLDQTLNLSAIGNFIIATAVQPDGKTLVGGQFNQPSRCPSRQHRTPEYGRHARRRFQPKRERYCSFQSRCRRTAIFLAGGNFNGANSIGGQTRNFIARLDATTGAADSFNPNANDDVYAIAVQADGKIAVGGRFTNIGGETRNRIARLDATTGLADSFNPNANNEVDTIAVQADGKILAGGFFRANSIGGQTRNRIARLDAATGLADSFDPNANAVVESIAVEPDGKILAGGDFTFIGGQPRSGSPGSVPRLAWRIRLTRTRTVLFFQSPDRRTARL